jgi:membrane associated rhomboid family serine protease
VTDSPPPVTPRPPQPPRLIPLPTVRPLLTYILLAINLLVFVLQSLTPDSQFGGNLLNPWFVYGAKINELITAGEWWRLITPIFLHFDILHLGVNSYSLYIFGPQVEALFGYRRYLITYLLSGVAGVVFSFAMTPSPSVGASGAIFGLVGAMLVYLYRHRRLFGEMGRRRLVDIGIVAFMNLLIGLNPGIDNWGHVGGLLGGALLSWLVGPIYAVRTESAASPPKVEDANPFNSQRWLAVFAVAFALAAATVVIAAQQP